ncbi:hypothetical protein BY458DRAFT_519299 [Sporodiniella umbellata]|nr:hypothetical protein BY458DRAFT_519299 [Sporodiniella umbellata]
MKDTIFDYKEEVKRENVVYHFQPTQRLEAIRTVIMDRCQQKRVSCPCAPSSPIEHIGGLPSPPVEEKKPVLEEEEEEEVALALSCQEIQAKIELLKEEKHQLFQRIKQMMQQEQTRKELVQAKSMEDEKRRWDNPSGVDPPKPTYVYPRPRYPMHDPTLYTHPLTVKKKAL